jgi:hypothetical protein
MAEISGLGEDEGKMVALFGQGRRTSTPLDWAKMDLANRSSNAEIAGSAENRDIARSEMDRRSQAESDRLAFDMDRLGFD